MQSWARAYISLLACFASSYVRSLHIPVSRANVAAVICGNTTAIDDYTEKHESQASNDLEQTEEELDLFQLARSRENVRWTCLAIALDTKHLDGNQSDKQRNDPSSVVNAFGSGPVVDDVASSGDLEGKHGQPADGVLPSAGETPRRIDEAADVHGEGAVDGVQDSQFCKSLHHEIASS